MTHNPDVAWPLLIEKEDGLWVFRLAMSRHTTTENILPLIKKELMKRSNYPWQPSR